MKNLKEKRHKCHFCGAVRYERKMRKLDSYEAENASPYFGNDDKCWACRRRCWRE